MKRVSRLYRSCCLKRNQIAPASFTVHIPRRNASTTRNDLNQLHKFSVAPMMDHTHQHFRNLARILSKRTLLFTEMIVDRALVHNEHNPEKLVRLLGNENVSNTILQLGGCDPSTMLAAAKLASKIPWAGINLNCGCPSSAAQSGTFGLTLMRDPQRVFDIVEQLVTLGFPVTVKCRLGVLTPSELKGITSWEDWAEKNYSQLRHFVEGVANMGAVGIILHARGGVQPDGNGKAWKPSDNRSVPPLFWDFALRLQQEFPNLHITLNEDLGMEDAVTWAGKGVGVMLGRAITSDPGLLALVDSRLFGDPSPPLSKGEALQQYLKYIVRQEAAYNDSVKRRGYESGKGKERDKKGEARHLLQPLSKFVGKSFVRASTQWISEGRTASDIIRKTIDRLPSSMLDLPASHSLPSGSREMSLALSYVSMDQ